MIEAGNEWAVPPPCLADARRIVAERQALTECAPDPLKHLEPKRNAASLPRDPFALHARMMDALIGDILDPQATSFPRLDALREVSKQSRGAVRANDK
jgi:hypothetical protein